MCQASENGGNPHRQRRRSIRRAGPWPRENVAVTTKGSCRGNQLLCLRGRCQWCNVPLFILMKYNNKKRQLFCVEHVLTTIHLRRGMIRHSRPVTYGPRVLYRLVWNWSGMADHALPSVWIVYLLARHFVMVFQRRKNVVKSLLNFERSSLSPQAKIKIWRQRFVDLTFFFHSAKTVFVYCDS